MWEKSFPQVVRNALFEGFKVMSPSFLRISHLKKSCINECLIQKQPTKRWFRHFYRILELPPIQTGLKKDYLTGQNNYEDNRSRLTKDSESSCKLYKSL